MRLLGGEVTFGERGGFGDAEGIRSRSRCTRLGYLGSGSENEESESDSAGVK